MCKKEIYEAPDTKVLIFKLEMVVASSPNVGFADGDNIDWN